MGAKISADRFIAELATRRRVVMLGGMAVIAHKLSRKTKDVDVWLELMATSSLGAALIRDVASAFPDAGFWSLPERRPLINQEAIAAAADDYGGLSAQLPCS